MSEVIDRGLASESDDRFKDCDDLAQAFLATLENPSSQKATEHESQSFVGTRELDLEKYRQKLSQKERQKEPADSSGLNFRDRAPDKLAGASDSVTKRSKTWLPIAAATILLVAGIGLVMSGGFGKSGKTDAGNLESSGSRSLTGSRRAGTESNISVADLSAEDQRVLGRIIPSLVDPMKEILAAVKRPLDSESVLNLVDDVYSFNDRVRSVSLSDSSLDERMITNASLQGFMSDVMKELPFQSTSVADAIRPVFELTQDAIETLSVQGMDKEVINEVGMSFRLIPPGRFLMGTSDDVAGREDNEHQRAAQILQPFYMSAHEVTQAQWASVMGTEPWQGNWGVSKESGKDKSFPVTYVTQQAATEFCRRMGANTGKTYRLPTEQEWEYACRAQTSTAYFFGNSSERLGDFAWFEDNTESDAGPFPQPVGKKKANPFGLFDTYGNVWEWCSDLYEETPGDDGIGITTDESAGYVIRGGSWYWDAAHCRSAKRSNMDGGTENFEIGFRVVLDAQSVPAN